MFLSALLCLSLVPWLNLLLHFHNFITMLFLVQFFLIAHLSSKVGKGPELAHMLSHMQGFGCLFP
jgi:hypothetical protein